jgi:hypothetical protein
MDEGMTPGFEAAREDVVRERYGLPSRAEQAALEATPAAVGRFALETPDIAGLTLLRRRLGWPAGTYTDVFGVGDDPQARVAVLVSQGGSRPEALERLVESLMQTMAVRLPDASELGLEVGEVAFAGGEDEVDLLLFVRGPIYFRVSSEGEKTAPVVDVARQVDTQASRFLAAE